VYLAKHDISTKDEQNARKETIEGRKALKVLSGMRHLYVAKGKKVIHLDLEKEKPATSELLSLLLGPSGNLRAPTMRKGKTVVVGFEESMYKGVLK
jgi:arsenate reductase-like glutaredoxin family protein